MKVEVLDDFFEEKKFFIQVMLFQEILIVVMVVENIMVLKFVFIDILQVLVEREKCQGNRKRYCIKGKKGEKRKGNIERGF